MNLDNINNILIVRFSSLGDVLLTTPVVRSLKAKYPNSKISFLVKKEFSDVYKYNPRISNLFIFDKSAGNINSLLDELKKQKFDLVIDLQNNFRSRKIVRRLNTKVITYHKNPLAKFLLVKFKINLLKNAPPIPLRYANAIAADLLDDQGLEIFTGKDGGEFENNIMIGLAPGSKHFTKRWPKEYFIELGKMIEEAGYSVALFGGISEQQLCKEISANLAHAVDFSNNNDLFLTIDNLNKLSLLICNDSGLMHAACAVNVPVFTIFGSSVKEFGFTPFRNKSIIFEDNLLSCRPCSHIGRSSCPKKHFKCMMEIKPKMVFDEIKNFVD
ncbi:MAG: glycosyltransferase family 9 protein [Bacteroidota bacterium]|nr:glycosyltransferase family 9 protein [Bacteroidota bacterium]